MLLKTVNFNIFQKELQDMVFGKDSELHPKNRSEEKTIKVRKLKEITLKPLNPVILKGKIFSK